MARENQKLKILYLLDILMQKTDEDHYMTANELCQELERCGVSAERKSIYSDIDALITYGVDILKGDRQRPGFGIGSREFELPELKVLVDSVQSAKFITPRKSDELIRKLEKLTSEHEARQLQRQVFIYNRSKADNETIYYNVDMIHSAISDQVQIRFQYGEWTREKKIRLRKGGQYYQVSPWRLTWDDECYYLIAYDEAADMIKHYRVDRMRSMELAEEKRLGQEQFRAFNLADFSKKTFGMFGGVDAEVTLLCENHFAGVIIDRFGTDVIMVPVGKDHFRTRFTVAVSHQFFGWITGLGTGVQILEPQSVRERYRTYLQDALRAYE